VLVTAPAAASVKCAKRHGVLRIYPYANPRIDLDFADAMVRRAGRRIEVVESGEVDCRGPQATLDNTRRVVFRQVGLSFGEVDLSGGLLRTARGRRIRITFVARPGALGYGSFGGVEGDQRWTVRPWGKGVGLWLRGAGGDPDALYRGEGSQVLFASLAGGDDRFDASALPRVRGRKFISIAEGGPGADRLFGSFGVDYLVGGDGSDRALGFSGADTIRGGDGRDLLGGGGGRDRIGAQDAARDVANCGAGEDKARLDRGDLIRSCETRHYGRYNPPPPSPPWARLRRIP
jgi:hypothetical protein